MVQIYSNFKNLDILENVLLVVIFTLQILTTNDEQNMLSSRGMYNETSKDISYKFNLYCVEAIKFSIAVQPVPVRWNYSL